MNSIESGQEITYRIRLKGVLKRNITDWLGDITIMPQENGETVLVGKFADQPALRGFLNQIWNLNFTLMSVDIIENETMNGQVSASIT